MRGFAVASKNLTIDIAGDASKFERAVRQAQKATGGLEKALNDAEAAVERRTAQRHQAMNKMGKSAVVAGAAMAAGLALATRAAVQWESAWAGVTKTVSGSAPEMAALEGELREMARTLPASHAEIAAVAEAAGQLGVRREDVAGFTKTMIDLGVSTNLSAEDAATSIAQFANVMGTMTREGSVGVERIGSALVALGNAGASTEADIMEMAQRLAGVGKVIGASESDVLALANALASMGIEAENGAGVMSRTMLKIYSAVKSGGDELDRFAAVAGMSGQQFAEAFTGDPIRATDAFVQGLSRIEASGGNVVSTLSDLDIVGTRDTQVLLSMKGAGDLLADSLDLGNQAWEENRALVDEANKRYETTEAKLKIARNSLNDFAIDIGNVLLPALGGLADGLSNLGGFLGSLPGPVKTALTVLGGLASVLALSGGAALLAVPKLHAMRVALEGLGVSAARTSSIMRALSATMKGGAIATAIVGVAIAVDQLVNALADDAPGVNALTDSLLDFAESGRVSGDAARIAGEGFAGLADKIKLAGRNKYQGMLLGDVIDPRKVQEARDELKALDQAFAGLVSSGNGEVVARAIAAAGLSAEQTADAFPDYTEAVRGASAESKKAQQPIEGVGGAMFATKEEAEAAEKSIREFAETVASFVGPLEAWQTALADAQEQEREGAEKAAEAHNKSVDEKIKATQRDYEAQIDAARKVEGVTEDTIHALEDQRDATVENLGEQKKSWEDYTDAVTVSVGKYLAELEKQVAAQRDWQTNMLALSGRVSQGTLDELARMGPEGAPLVAELVEASDEELAKLEELFAARSQGATEAFAVVMRDAKPVLEQIAREQGAGVARELSAALAAGETTVAQIMQRYGLTIESGVVVPMSRANTNVRQLDEALRNLPATTKVSVSYSRRVMGEGSVGGDAEFSGGGYTGSGGKYQPAGVVHGGEYVHRQEAVNYYGRAYMDDINSLRAPRGYAEGGYVSTVRVAPASSNTVAASPRGPLFESLVINGRASVEDAREAIHALRDLQHRAG